MRLGVALLSLLLIAGCQSTHKAGRVVTDIARAPDGLPIVYDVRGGGETSLVFIHCWCCDRAFWREQLDEFADEYRVVALDLGGHGASGAEREPWTVASLAGDVEAVVKQLKLRRVILIGHSMGGPVALLAAGRMPQRVIGVVAVDTCTTPSSSITRTSPIRWPVGLRRTLRGPWRRWCR